MAKKWQKQKAKHQKVKQRKSQPGSGSGSSFRASGMMGGLRRGMKNIAGTNRKKAKKVKSGFEKIVDAALWIAVFAVGSYFVFTQCGS